MRIEKSIKQGIDLKYVNMIYHHTALRKKQDKEVDKRTEGSRRSW